MTVYGITRASTRKQQASPEVQAEMIRKHCASVGLPEPTILDEPLALPAEPPTFGIGPKAAGSSSMPTRRRVGGDEVG